ETRPAAHRPSGPPGPPPPAAVPPLRRGPLGRRRPVPGRTRGGSGGGGVMADAEAEQVLDGLRRQARKLVADLAGPVRRVRLSSGESVLEVEWHDPAAPAQRAAEPAEALPARAAEPAARAAPVADRPAVRSPVVGTFYRAPEPGAMPFVAVGDLVRPGQVVGIVEAMKLMNEVTAGQAGRVVEVLVDDGKPVEYDQPLIALEPVTGQDS
ncbi:acetyl-CoA carboxylase biotin carboxyl carrier protein, partial [Micromonospora tulbaghiae]|uniref:acetyl-CoA carboxylase biotin carboxyl carrier protein n=1 Tax=Micromonospora tulbaghiae TaxID=479978 RepID=UPI003F4CFD1E